MTTSRDALQAAYKLGVLDGQIKMASIGIAKAEASSPATKS
jgi:hypothetical protein